MLEAVTLQSKMNWNESEMRPLLEENIMNRAVKILRGGIELAIYLFETYGVAA